GSRQQPAFRPDPRLSGNKPAGGLHGGRPSGRDRIHGKTIRGTHPVQTQLRVRAGHAQPEATGDDSSVARRTVNGKLKIGRTLHLKSRKPKSPEELLSGRLFPSSAEEGWLRHQYNAAKPPLGAQPGWCWSMK